MYNESLSLFAPIGDRPTYYAVIPAALIADRRLTDGELRTYAALSLFVDASGYASPPMAVLAKHSHCSTRQLERRLARLESFALIARVPQHDESGGQTPNRYRLSHINPPDIMMSPPIPADSLSDASIQTTPPDIYSIDVLTIFDYWRDRLDHPGAHLTDLRRRKITARLREGMTVAEARRIIDNASSSEFHRGKNDGKFKYDTIEKHLFSSRDRVEWWLNRDGDDSQTRRINLIRKLKIDLGTTAARAAATDEEWAQLEAEDEQVQPGHQGRLPV